MVRFSRFGARGKEGKHPNVSGSEREGYRSRKLLMLSSGSYNSTLAIRLRDLARHLANVWDITIVAPSADKYNAFIPDYSLKPTFAKLVQPRQVPSRWPMVNLIPYLFSALAQIVRAQADMVIIYKPTPITALGLVAKLVARTPVVLDLDDLGSQVMKREGRSRLSCSLVAWSERLCMRYADAVVVVSTTLHGYLLRLHPAKRVLLLPNGVEPNNYRAAVDQRPRRAVYFFGAINKLDLIENLLRAMPEVLGQVSDARLSIVGGGSALEDAKHLSRELDIEAAVTFLGWQTNMLAVQEYTQFADIGVCYLPDRFTARAASNMKVFQYMAMGTVPLVSDVGDLRSYVRDGRAGSAVMPGNVGALARALIELLQDEETRICLSTEARRLACEDYSWETRAKVLIGFLDQLTKS
jgi:glycosyltransferase involved in cell wall biosynthesis